MNIYLPSYASDPAPWSERAYRKGK